ncbi:hypothetical protein D1007_55952 [Hordeum vulgare]|nr:hypothetical protein D1007_55952 [Hordeum vulgare]
MVAHANEALMAAMRADPRIWEEHLAVEDTIDSSHADDTTRLAALNDNSWCFLEGYARAFDKDYKLFSQRVCAILGSKSDRLVPGQAQDTHHYEEGGTHDVEA